MKLTRYPETYNPILEYWQAIENGRETVSLKVQKTYRHVVEQLGATDSEFYYSPRRANHVLEFFENYCHHSKGKAGGQLVKLELWEKALLATVFGFMRNADGTTGPHWSMDQTTAIVEGMGVQETEIPRWAWGVTMNMMYSDYYPVAVEFGLNRPEFYAALAKAFLLDKDGPGPEHKLMEYYEHIAK